MKVRRETQMVRVRMDFTSCDQYEQQEMRWYPLIEKQEFQVNLISICQLNYRIVLETGLT